MRCPRAQCRDHLGVLRVGGPGGGVRVRVKARARVRFGVRVRVGVGVGVRVRVQSEGNLEVAPSACDSSTTTIPHATWLGSVARVRTWVRGR